MIIDQNFEFVAGDSVRLTIPIVDEAGAPLVLAGYEASWAMSKGVGRTPVLEKDTFDGITIDGSSLIVELYPEDTVDVKSGKYYHEVEITAPDDVVSTVTSGTITVRSGLVNN